MKSIPYGRQHISQADIDAVVEALQADFLTQENLRTILLAMLGPNMQWQLPTVRQHFI